MTHVMTRGGKNLNVQAERGGGGRTFRHQGDDLVPLTTTTTTRGTHILACGSG